MIYSNDIGYVIAGLFIIFIMIIYSSIRILIKLSDLEDEIMNLRILIKQEKKKYEICRSIF